MAVTISPQQHRLEAARSDELRKLFESGPFILLREVIAANCVMAQLASMNALVYPDNELAKTDMVTASQDAIKLNSFLDLLDDLVKTEEKWFTITLEPSR